MSAAPVGESRADEKGTRRGPLIRAVRASTASAKRVAGLPLPHLPSGVRMFPFAAPTTPTSIEPPPEEETLGIDYDGAWARKPAASAARRIVQATLLRPSVDFLTKPEVFGEDRLAGLEGPVVFVANHHSHLDTGLLLRSLPMRFRKRTVVAAASDYFFDKQWKAVLSSLSINAIPIERQKVSRRSLDQVMSLLRKDWNIVIFPEGGRSPDGWAGEFHPGAAFLAIRRVCPIVPVHIDGTDIVLPKGATRPKRHACAVTFGFPINVTENDDARALTERVESAIELLGDERRSDWWTARRRAANGTGTNMHGPSASSWRRTWEKTRTEAARDVDRERGKRRWP